MLLDIIKSESLPLREVFELANPLSPLNQPIATTANGDGDDAGGGSSTRERRLPYLTTEDVAWATAPAVQGPPIVAAAIYCLYGIYYAQPGPLLVKIRISKEHQQTIMQLATYLAQSNALDALSLLKDLVKENALLPSSSLQPDTSLTNVNINTTAATTPGGGGVDGVDGVRSQPASTLAPGVGALYIIPGLRSEDAGTLREVHFHLDSTLTGLGTAHLDPLCRGYGEKLKDLWTSLGQSPSTVAEDADNGRASGRLSRQEEEEEQQVEGIADLSLGRYIHEYATKKREELHLILQHGPNWNEKVLKRERELAAKAPKVPETTIKVTTKTTVAGTATITRKKTVGSRKKVPSTAAAAAAVSNIPGVPGNVARQLAARENARTADITRRSKPWAERLGVDNVVEKELRERQQATAAALTGAITGGFGVDSDDDMPFVPGLQSQFEYLAGPSDAGGGGGGRSGRRSGGSTKKTATTIQGKRGQRRNRGSSSDSDSDDSTSDSSSSSSESDSSSSEDSTSSDSSDGEEVEMEQRAKKVGQRKLAAGRRTGARKAAAGTVGDGGAAAGSRGKGGGTKGGKTAPAVSANRGGQKGKAKGKGKGKARGGAGAAEKILETEVDVMNYVNEIDMALAEDDLAQI